MESVTSVFGKFFSGGSTVDSSESESDDDEETRVERDGDAAARDDGEHEARLAHLQ